MQIFGAYRPSSVCAFAQPASPRGSRFGLCEYVLSSKFQWQFLLTAFIQRHSQTNPMPTTTGGAYHSVCTVTKCECRDFQIRCLPKLHRSTRPASPSTLFSPHLFSCERKDGAAGGMPGNIFGKFSNIPATLPCFVRLYR